LPVVDALDELADPYSGVGQVAIVTPVDLLLLQRAHEALGLRIVVRVADPAHAGLDLVASEADAVVTILALAAGELSEERLADWIRANSVAA
jgi:hypothetical protein